jgi:hypothetical protein
VGVGAALEPSALALRSVQSRTNFRKEAMTFRKALERMVNLTVRALLIVGLVFGASAPLGAAPQVGRNTKSEPQAAAKPLRRLWSTHRPRAIEPRSDVGRSAAAAADR